ncbi:hypothetical protein Agabi119p4_7124 [Agaricus bisporus var. burnettii]|uniref:F-box domain-containing protein n=1 Tax=Agaricus bisporus var. burnettii TaxID=192524 RepID=A0A8H7C7I2_AGABI|nr:hypothetical protein Agabi119p4_7124 [Agaricus bisporus var. burnettii]
MNICDRCHRLLDPKQPHQQPHQPHSHTLPFKSTSDEIIFYQSEVRRVEHEIERLTTQRVEFQRKLNEIAAVTVRLPFEIISTIFQVACPVLDIGGTNSNSGGCGEGGGDTTSSSSTLSSSSSSSSASSSSSSLSTSKDGGITYPSVPFKLASVCSQWRDIALSTPQLWTSLSFSLYQSRNLSNAIALDTFFQRAGSCQMTISLIFATGDEGRERLDNDIPPSQDVLRVFVKHSKRWGHLKIDGLPPEWIPILRAAKYQTPSLEQLWLCPYDNSREQQMVDIFTEAPNLTKVTLDNTFLSAIMLPWSGLRELKVSWVSIDECVEMLKRCPRLEECDFQRILSNAEFHTLPQPEDPPLVMPNLHTLRWSYAGDAWEFQLFQRIQFPKLRSFKMRLRYDLTNFIAIQEVLSRVLKESSPGVECLELDLGCPWGNVWEILKVVPKVKEVRLVNEHDSEFVRGLMGALVVPYDEAEAGVEEGEMFLPQLRSLEFTGTNPTDWSFPKLVVDQLGRRWEKSRVLERVNLELTSEVYVDGRSVHGGQVKDGLKTLLREGMLVRVANGFDGRPWV